MSLNKVHLNSLKEYFSQKPGNWQASASSKANYLLASRKMAEYSNVRRFEALGCALCLWSEDGSHNPAFHTNISHLNNI